MQYSLLLSNQSSFGSWFSLGWDWNTYDIVLDIGIPHLNVFEDPFVLYPRETSSNFFLLMLSIKKGFGGPVGRKEGSKKKKERVLLF